MKNTKELANWKFISYIQEDIDYLRKENMQKPK